MEPVIGLATVADLDALRDIYNYYVERSTCTYMIEPETAAQRLAWFQSHGPAHPVTVTEHDGEVIGWASLSSWSSRCGYSRTAEASVYVKHGLDRKGLGRALLLDLIERALLLDLIERAKTLGDHVIIGGASADQTASLELQYALGFERVAHFKETGYKFGKWLDVIYTQLILT